MEQLTSDHSLAHRGAAYAHILTRALGVQPDVEVDLIPVSTGLRAGDVFLLCSDGLWGQVSDADIAAIVAADSDLQVASQRLVDAANMRGGPDNISVIVARVAGMEDESWARALGGRIDRAWSHWVRRRHTPKA